MHHRSAGAAWAGFMIAMIATTAVAQADNDTPRMDGPFNVLEWADGVTTSRSGYAVWVSIGSTRHQVQLPGHTRKVGSPEHGAALHVSCRAAGGVLPDRFPPTGPHGGIYLDNHPEDTGAYTVLHPMYWFLEFTGRAEERWPVRIGIGNDPPVAGELVRARTNYSAPRPGLDITLPGHKVIDAMTGANPIAIEVKGPQMHLSAEFSASDNARRAAALMRKACVQTDGGENSD